METTERVRTAGARLGSEVTGGGEQLNERWDAAAGPGADTESRVRAHGARGDNRGPGRHGGPTGGRGGPTGGYAPRRQLWVEEPAARPRLPDPVRRAAVRAVLIVAVTLVQAMTAFFCALAESWLAFPMVLSSVASTVAATWGVLDVWVTRQVWSQRNGVVSAPSSTARQLRRERRRARRAARAAARASEDIRGRGATGRLSHP
ncbi:hypothetical protein GCM10018785_52760 [Streptomyces longispororuber]|uniref:Uncharacterized protein n=1 Tax=Streptomyces longispororuber TaxID=68230 RepID=A0A919DU69_9ACTN|nr:hypothetical protein GCM10018785_52760 [Streptomyces longispororuber]